MSEIHIAYLALGISVSSIGGQVWNAWLKLRIRADLAELTTKLDGRYQSRDVCESERHRLDERIDAVSY